MQASTIDDLKKLHKEYLDRECAIADRIEWCEQSNDSYYLSKECRENEQELFTVSSMRKKLEEVIRILNERMYVND